MSFNSFLSKIFGNKSQRDLKEIQPVINKIKACGEKLKSLDNDALRQTVSDVRTDIKKAIEPDETAIASLKTEIESLPFDKRQPLWDDIDRHEKNILDTIEEKLNEHLPIVFAAMRETAARFAANPTVEVTATQMDRGLSQPPARISSASKATRPSGKTTGWLEATRSRGTWCITTCS